jgi:hypothetical protein
MRTAELTPHTSADTQPLEQRSGDSGDNPFGRRPRRIHFEPDELRHNQARIAAMEQGSDVAGEPAQETDLNAFQESPVEVSRPDFTDWVNGLPSWLKETADGAPLSSSQLLDLYEGSRSYVDMHEADRRASRAVGEQAATAVQAMVEHIPLVETVDEQDAKPVVIETAHLDDGLDARFEMTADGTIGAMEVVVAETATESEEPRECDIVVARPESADPYIELDGKPVAAEDLPIVEAVLAHVVEVAVVTAPAEQVSEQGEPVTPDEVDSIDQPVADEPVSESSPEKPRPTNDVAAALKTKHNALRYFSDIAKQSPEMSAFLQQTVASLAAERGVEPAAMMRMLGEADTPPSPQSLAALKMLSQEGVRADSPLWRESASSRSMLGQTAGRYRLAMATALRGMVPPVEKST